MRNNLDTPFLGLDFGGALHLDHPLCRGVWGWWPHADGAGGRVSEVARVSAADRYWTLNAAAGTAAWSVAESCPSKLPAITYDGGSNSYSVVSGSGGWGADGAQTYAVWVRNTGGSGATGVAVLNQGVNGAQVRIYYHTDGNFYFGAGGTFLAIGYSSVVTQNKWTHLTMVLGGPTNSVYVYKDGLPLGGTGTAFAAPSWADTSSAYIGRAVPQNGVWTGQITDLWRWTRYLTREEVYEFYQQSLRGYPGLIACPAAAPWALAVGTGGTAYTSAPDGACTTTGALSLSTMKAASGSSGGSGAFSGEVLKTFSGSGSLSGAVARLGYKALSGAVNGSGALSGLSAKVLDGAVQGLGTLSKQGSKLRGGTVIGSGALCKQDSRPTTGTIVTGGAVLLVGVKSTAGTVSGTGNLNSNAFKGVVGSVQGEGALSGVKRASLTVIGSTQPAGTIGLGTLKRTTGSVAPTAVRTIVLPDGAAVAVVGRANQWAEAMIRNASNQTIDALLLSTMAAPVGTGTTTVYVTIDGVQAQGTGTVTYSGRGVWTYGPTRAETNGAHVSFLFVNAMAVSVNVQVFPDTNPTGTGAVFVSHDYGGTGGLRYVDGDGMGIRGAAVTVYTRSDYDAGLLDNRYAVGRTTTDADGRWLTPVAVDPGTYKVVFSKPGSFGPDAVDLVVS